MVELTIIKYDITKLEVDVIVNAANKSLMGGSGVDEAIHRVAGHQLLDECIRIRKDKYVNGLPTGQVAVTPAFNLKAKYIFHTVGPINGKDDIMLLRDCYVNCINLAKELRVKSIAFPAISTGAHSIPIERSAQIVKKVIEELKSNLKIIFVMYSDRDKAVYDKVLEGSATNVKQ